MLLVLSMILSMPYTEAIEINHKAEIFKNVTEFLFIKNDIHANSIFIVTSNDAGSIDNDGVYYSAFRNASLLRNKLISHLYIDNDMKKVYSSIGRSAPALVIILCGNSLTCFSEFFISYPKNYFEKNMWWMMYDTTGTNNSHSLKLISEYLHEANLLTLVSQIYILTISKSDFSLCEVYQPCVDTYPVTNYLIYTRNEGSANVLDDKFIWPRRRNLTGCKIRMAYVNSNSFFEESVSDQYNQENKIKKNLGGEIFYGTRRPFFDFVTRHLNFTVVMKHSGDNRYGTFDPGTKLWDGVIGMLSRKEADMSVQRLAITQLRSKAIAYSIPFINAEHRLFLMRPEPSPSWTTFINVLGMTYWKSLILVVFSCILCLFLSMAFSSYDSLITSIDSIGHELKQAIITTLRAMVTYDIIEGGIVSERNSKRFVLGVICLFGMVNYYVYNGGLIASLMVQHYEMPIKELKDFLDKPEYQLLIKRGGSTELYFSQSSEDHLKQIWSKIQKDNSSISNVDKAEKIIKADHRKVLLYPSIIFRHVYKSFPCEVSDTGFTYFQEGWAFAYNNESTYLPLFNYYIAKGMELGLEAYPVFKEKDCNSHKEEIFRPINIGDIFPAFVVVGTGCLISTILCLLEYIH